MFVSDYSVITSRRSYRKKSQNARTITSETSNHVPSQLKFRIHKSNSPHNLFSVRSMPTHYCVDKKVAQVPAAQQIKSLEQQTNKIYTLKQIPECHIEIIKSIRQRLNNSQYELKLMKSELKDLKSPHSCIFALRLLCEARQSCIATIKTLVEQAKSENSNFNTQIKSIRDHINDLRVLTISCIQKILKWKQNLLEFCKFTEQNIVVYFSYCKQDKGNYLLKMLNDTQFLFMSGLFKDNSFPDPFFLSYQQEELKMDMKKYFKLRACQLLLLEESL